MSIELFEMNDSPFQWESRPHVGLRGKDLMGSEASGSDQDAFLSIDSKEIF